MVLNEICNILLVKNLELQYYALQNGNVVGTDSPTASLHSNNDNFHQYRCPAYD